VSTLTEKRGDGGEVSTRCGPRFATKEADHADLALFTELCAQGNDDGARSLTGTSFTLVKKV
jgi:hypothetical protein